MKFSDLEGKTIAKAEQMKLVGCDDDGYLKLTFTDGTKATIVAYYGGYTGKSEDEYPTGIAVHTETTGKLESL
jgi:hypothetical protein